MLTINNPFGAGAPAGLAVQIAYRVGSKWETDDLTDMGSKTWCRADPADKVEEVIVMVSNSNLPPAANSPAFSKPVAVVRDACGFTGEAHGTHTFNLGTEWVVEVDATDLVFLPSGASVNFYKPISGTIKTTYSGVYYNDTDETPGPCTVSGSLTVPVGPDDGYISIIPQQGGSITYSLAGNTSGQVALTISCPGDPPTNATNISQYWMLANSIATANANLLEGNALGPPTDNSTSEFNWHFERSQAPTP
jgi:hypothetical protein